MVTFTTPPFRAAVRLNSGVSAQNMTRIAISVLLYALGLSCIGVAVCAVGAAVHEYTTLPASEYKDSSLSAPALIVPIFCGLVLLAIGQRVRLGSSTEASRSER